MLSPSADFLESKTVEFASRPTHVRARAIWFSLFVIFGCGLAFFWHFWLSFHFPLSGDEAYYWLWSKHPALGYHDHPPLIGWLIAISTLWSDQEFFVRLPAIVCFVGGVFLFFSFSRNLLGSSKKAGWSFLFFLYAPLLAISSIAVFTDTPLVFSWILAMWAGWKALRDGRYWLLAGMAVGLAVLSKLVGLFLPVSFAFYFLMNRRARFWLRTKVFWRGVGVSLLVSLPVWIWNGKHHFENVIFQIHDHLGALPPNPILSFLGYAGVQALNVSPLLFCLLAFTFVQLVNRSVKGEERSQFLLAFALPIHVIFALLAFGSRVGFHWALPGTIPLLVACVDQESLKKWLPGALGVAMMLSLLFFWVLGYPTAGARLITPLAKRHPEWNIAPFLSGKGYGEILGYRKLSEETLVRVHAREKEHPTFLITDSYTLSSMLSYYTKHQVYTFLPTGQGGEFARWGGFDALRGQNALWVGRTPPAADAKEWALIREAFSQTREPERIIVADGPITRVFYATPLENLKVPAALKSWSRDVPAEVSSP